MDDNYPTLKRSKKKLTYPTTKTRLNLNQWTQEKMTLEDVEKMFDDLDSKGADDLPSPSPEIHIPNKKHVGRDVSPVPLKEQYSEELSKCQMVPNGDHPPLCQTSTSPDLDIDSEIPFKAHGPVKTSSPIEGNAIQHKHKEQNKEKDCKDNSASPILFDCEEEANLVSGPAEKPSEKPQHNNCRRDESDDSIFETLPRKAVLIKTSTQKKNAAPTRDCRSKTSSPPVSPVRPEPTSGAPEKHTESAQMPSRVKHDMNSFLQKLRDAGQHKPACAGISQPKVMPPPPEPEDDFLILEDDAPFYVSIPSKSAKSLKEKQNKTSSSDKETKDTSGEGQSVDKQQDTEQHSRKQEIQTLNENPKKKAKRDKVSQSHSNESDIDKDQHILPMFEPAYTNNLVDQGKTKKKKIQMKKIPSKDDNHADDKDLVAETDNGNSSEKTEKKTVRTVEKKGSKSLQNKKGNVQKKRTLASKQSRKGANKTSAITDVIEQSQECTGEDQVNNDALVSEDISNLETEPTKDLADRNLKQNISSSSIEGTSDGVLGKRKRKQTGQWWISCPQNPEQHPTDKQLTIKKAKQASKDSSGAAASPVKATTNGRKKNLKPSSSSSSDSQRQQADKKKVKKSKIKTAKSERPAKMKQTENSDEVFAEPIQDRALDQDSDSDSSPLLFLHRERSISSGERVFHKVFVNSSNEKSMGPEEQLTSGEATKRRRKCPGNWWQVNPTREDLEVASSQPQQLKPKKHKTVGENKLQTKKPTAHSPSKPLEGAPKQKKRSLATFTDLCSTVTVSPPVSKKTGTQLKKQQNATSVSAENIEAQYNVVSMETDESRGVHETVQESTSKVLRSGPSSMIELENYEEDIVLPSTTVQSALCVSDLCAPPLRPLILQPKDKVNLKDWLKVLWSATDSGTELTPDDFQWYCYQGRAIGFMVDLHTGSISNGKMLLGSFMKKPLWVDHSATTVFNLLTSSVSLIVDCNKSCYNAGQSFMVPSGHAYSIHNLSAQPAVLYFTRIFAEESDE